MLERGGGMTYDPIGTRSVANACSRYTKPMRITLKVTSGPHTGREFCFVGHDTFIVGRSKQAHFRLPAKDKYFSRLHFLIEVNPPQCRLMDLGSRNGTFLNGEPVHGADIKHGDVIRAGHTFLRVSVEEAPAEQRPPVAVAPVSPEEPRAASPVLPTFPAEASAWGSSEFVLPALQEPLPEPVLSAAFPPVDESLSHSFPVPLPEPEPTTGKCPVCEASVTLPVSDSAGARPRPERAPMCPACQAAVRAQEQLIDGYQIVRPLGRGGMGVVYLAVRTRDTLPVALKTISPTVTGTRDQVERFFREADILRQLDHPHIVHFLEMGECNGLFYFAMDYVRGIDAARLQAKWGGPLPTERAVRLVCQLLQALDYAHSHKFVHRDIKPGNLLVADEGGREVVKLADFGLARVYQASQLSGLTLQGEMGGTVAFMAPEQIIQFREARPPVDQYAASATLYKLLTDQYIFDLPRQVQRQIGMILQEEPIPIHQRRPDIPPLLAAATHRALAKNPDDRFPDVEQFLQALLPFGR